MKTRRKHFASVEDPEIPGFSLWLWRNEAQKIFLPCFIYCGLSGNRRFSGVFGLLKMVTFGDDDNMVERFVEIDASVFREGTAHVASFFQLTGPGTRAFLGICCEAKCLRRA